jgi:hypothetical protein
VKREVIAERHWKWATNALNAANRDTVSRDPQCTRATTFLTEIRTLLRKAGVREDQLDAVPPLPGSNPLQPGGESSGASAGRRK